MFQIGGEKQQFFRHLSNLFFQFFLVPGRQFYVGDVQVKEKNQDTGVINFVLGTALWKIYSVNTMKERQSIIAHILKISRQKTV